MLYDNALLGAAYVDSFLATGNAEHGRIVRETLDYVLRDMTDPIGGFHSTEDADSEGEEGRFYLWTPAQVREVLEEPVAERFCEVYDVTETGNFEGRNILNLPRSLPQLARLRGWPYDELAEQMTQARRRLLAARQRRVRPSKDDKIIVSWNGLMIDTLARARGPSMRPNICRRRRLPHNSCEINFGSKGNCCTVGEHSKRSYRPTWMITQRSPMRSSHCMKRARSHVGSNGRLN